MRGGRGPKADSGLYLNIQGGGESKILMRERFPCLEEEKDSNKRRLKYRETRKKELCTSIQGRTRMGVRPNS